MSSSKVRNTIIIAVALLMVISSVAIATTSFYNSRGTSTSSNSAAALERSIVTGSQVNMIQEKFGNIQQKILKYGPTPMPGSDVISFMVNFKVPNSAALALRINQENNPYSPYYHHYLRPSDFMPGAVYGPSQSVYQATISYYKQMGMNVVQKFPLGIEFSGTVAQVNKAFETTMVHFTVNGTQKYANLYPLSIPTAIAKSISSIDGLTNLMTYKPAMVLAPHGAGVHALSTLSSPSVTKYLSQSQVLNFSRHSFAWANVPGYGLTQFLFPTTMPLLYNATDLISHGYNGKGITIAVVMGAGYNPSDLKVFSKEVFNNSNQLLNRLTAYPVNGAVMPGTTTFSWSSGLAGEYTLDLEYSSTMAPGAHLDAVYGPDLSTMSLDTVYQKIVSLPHTPNIVTNSWGGDEDLWFNLYGPSYQNAYTMNYLFEVLASMGSTVFFSSGDSAGVGFFTNFLTPSFGSSSPYVVGVGGVRTVANSTSGKFPTGNVSNFTLAPYSNQPANGGFWFPNFGLNVANATGIASQSYWYTPGRGGVPFAGGQVGLSYWFNQSYYQHGFGIQTIGRQNSVTISGEGDFNETEFFAGMWVFFWGGTSFACPTVAGEFADILSYLNATIGMNYTYLNPDIYEVGNFASTFSLSPFYYVSNGSNPWAAANQVMGWPNNLSYPVNWTLEHTGYTYLTGFGTVNAYNFAHDLVKVMNYQYRLVNPKTGSFISSMDGTVLSSGTVYTFNVTNSAGSAVPNAYVNITVVGASGSVIGYLHLQANASGNVTVNTTGYGNDTFMINVTSGGSTSYWYVFVKEVLTSGTLKVKVLQSTIMGGFSAYNNMLSYQYPGYAPLYPNTVEVLVTLNGKPVSGAYVYAQQKNYVPLYSAPNETSTSMRSVGFTNGSGIAFVDTWNVADNTTYFVNATYLGLQATTTMNVTPQYSVLPKASNFQQMAPMYTGIITLPAATPGTSYTVQERVMNYNMTSGEVANVSIGAYMSFPGFLLQDITPVVTTSPAGYFNITINGQFAPGLYYINVTTPNQKVAFYNGFAIRTPSTYVPLLITGSVGGNFMPVSPQGIPSLYAGQGWMINGEVSTNYQDPIFGNSMYINGGMTTGPVYSFNYGPQHTFAVGTNLSTDPQDALAMTIPFPANLSLGLNTFTVLFNDTLFGISYNYTLDFYVISTTSSTVPTASISVNNGVSPTISGGSGTYYTGPVTFNLSSDEAQYVTSTVSISGVTNSVMLSFVTTGMSTFTYDFASLASGTYAVEYTVTNPNGETAHSTVTISTQPANTVTFKETGLALGTTWSVTFNGKTLSSSTSVITFTGIAKGSYSFSVSSIAGYKTVKSGTVDVTGNTTVQVTYAKVPISFTVTFKETGLASGTTWNITFNGQNYSSSTDTITITNVAQGTYSYTIGNVSGYASPGSSSISVNGNSVINVAFAKIPKAPGMSAAVVGYIIGGIIGGLIVGGVVVYAITRKPKA